MHDQSSASVSAAGLRIAVVVSRYHQAITSALRDGAVAAFVESGGDRAALTIVDAPGSFELTAVCATLADLGRHDAIVALGCVLSGETTHDQYISQAVAGGLTQITVESCLPISFGLLTCQSMQQAQARAGGEKGNKGREAMLAAIEAAGTIRHLRQSKGRA